MDDLRITERIVIRPVYLRLIARGDLVFGTGNEKLPPPTDEEKADAIAVMEECYPPIWEIDEILLREAELILIESSGVEDD